MPVKKAPMINNEIDQSDNNFTNELSEANHSMSLTQENMLSLIELFFFAYRDFTEEGDEILDTFGFGRAHHRVIHFVHHYPGLRVADLLSILKITKQSLARVLKQLIEQDFICQKEGSKDRRERLLFTTDKGNKLARELAEPQINRFEATMSQFSKEEQKIFEKFLFKLIRQSNRQDVISLMAQNGHFPDGKPD